MSIFFFSFRFVLLYFFTIDKLFTRVLWSCYIYFRDELSEWGDFIFMLSNRNNVLTLTNARLPRDWVWHESFLLLFRLVELALWDFSFSFFLILSRPRDLTCCTWIIFVRHIRSLVRWNICNFFLLKFLLDRNFLIERDFVHIHFFIISRLCLICFMIYCMASFFLRLT